MEIKLQNAFNELKITGLLMSKYKQAFYRDDLITMAVIRDSVEFDKMDWEIKLEYLNHFTKH